MCACCCLGVMGPAPGKKVSCQVRSKSWQVAGEENAELEEETIYRSRESGEDELEANAKLEEEGSYGRQRTSGKDGRKANAKLKEGN